MRHGAVYVAALLVVMVMVVMVMVMSDRPQHPATAVPDIAIRTIPGPVVVVVVVVMVMVMMVILHFGQPLRP